MLPLSRRRSVRKELVYPLTCLVFLTAFSGILVWQFREHSDRSEPPDLPIAYFESLQRQGEDAIPELLEWLDSENVTERRGAAYALFRLRPTSVVAREALLRHLDDPDVQVRQHSFAALFQVGIHLPRLVGRSAEFLADQSDETRRWATNLLLRIGRDAAPYMIPLLSHPRADTRLQAGRIFQDVGGWHPDFDEVLLQVIRDQATGDSELRIRPTTSVGSRVCLNESSSRVECSRWRLATIEQIPGPEIDCPALAELVAPYLDHERSAVRTSATRLLRLLGPGCRDAVIRQLDSSRDETIRHALCLLSGYRDFDPPLLERLRVMFDECQTSANVRADTLALIIASGEATTEEYRLALRPESPICRGALELLCSTPDLAPAFIPEMLVLLDDDQQRYSESVLRTLARIESLSDEAKARIRPLLRADHPMIRLAAARTLRKSPIDRREVEAALFEVVVSGQVAIPMAVETLVEVAPDFVPKVVEQLRARLLDGPRADRKRAFRLVAALGRRAAPVLPEIRATLEDEDPEWVSFALLAIAGIGPEAESCVPRLAELLSELDNRTMEGQEVEATVATMFDCYLVDALMSGRPESSRAGRQLALFVDQPARCESRFNLILAAIEQLGPAGRGALSAVVRRLDDLESQPASGPVGYSRAWRKQRCALLQTLARIAPDDSAVTTRLRSLLTDRFPEARLWSASLLLDRNDSDDDCVEALAELVSGSTPMPERYLPLSFQGDSIPKLAASRLKSHGRQAVSALDALAGGVRQRSSVPLRGACLQALRAIIADARKTEDHFFVDQLLPVLQQTLYDDHRENQRVVLQTLALLGSLARECAPELRRAARDWQPDVSETERRVWLTGNAGEECLGVAAVVSRGPTFRQEILQALSLVQTEP